MPKVSCHVLLALKWVKAALGFGNGLPTPFLSFALRSRRHLMQELLDKEWPLIATDASAPHTGNVPQ